jgi:phosphoribosylglycinamide formyltransferase 2
MREYTIGTPLSSKATRLMLLGSGELGREIAIESVRLGLEVIAVDRYENAPAMQVAQRSAVINMLDPEALRDLILSEKPDFVVPEVEAIATDVLVELEKEGFQVVPVATATQLTMDREGIRTLAARELGLPTSDYIFAGSKEECLTAIEKIGMPCFVKPVMSSSGKGQMKVETIDDAEACWQHAVLGGRGTTPRVIVEGLIDFEYEITLLTVKHSRGIEFCPPIGHIQVDGDYRESWQPQAMSKGAYAKSVDIATSIVESLGGYGVFGVELFVKGDDVWFSEVSPRPHDTGMVTLISQQLSQFALHVRAALGCSIAPIENLGPSASCAILGHGTGDNITYAGISDALSEMNVDLKIFGKPDVVSERRLGVALGRAESVKEARAKARRVAKELIVSIG